MAQADADAKPIAPIPLTNDHRELGYGNVDARADIDGGDEVGDLASGEEAYPTAPVPDNQDADVEHGK